MRVLFAVMLAAVLLVTFTVPVLADSPDVPGAFGDIAADFAQNQDGPGTSPEIKQGKLEASFFDMNLGQYFKLVKAVRCGIPPRHQP